MSDDEQQPHDPRGEPWGRPQDSEGTEHTEHTRPIWQPADDEDPSGPGHEDASDDAVGTRGTRVVPPPPVEDGETSWFPAGTGRGRRPRSRRRGVAALAALSLLLGVGGGFAGAAAFQAIDDEDAATTQAPAYTSAARDSDDQGSDEVTRSGVDGSQAPTDGSIESVAQSTLPSVVQIDVVSNNSGSALGSGGAPEGGSGSGIILSSDGQILTNNHVVELAEDGGKVSVSFNDGSAAEAEVLGTDSLTDTALIQANGVSGLDPATIGKSGNLSVGQDVVAVGSPFGLDSTVTTGIVSALERPVSVGSDTDGNSTTYPAIQTDAAINPGNSGGPLVDLGGRVVGINSSIRTAGGGLGGEAGSIGLGFAIPIDEVLPIVDQMANGEQPTHARLGVSVGDVAVAGLPDSGFEGDASDLPRVGALVREVPDGGAAAGAGLQNDDVITGVDDTLITGSDSLVATIRSYRPGDKIEVTWVRGGERQSATLELGTDADIAQG